MSLASQSTGEFADAVTKFVPCQYPFVVLKPNIHELNACRQFNVISR
jgi:hypothetical protein